MITTEKADGIMTITLDRPEKLNSLNLEMMTGLFAAFDDADTDDDVRVVVVTGRGRAFSAGADLSAGEGAFTKRAATGSEDAVIRDGGGVLTLRIFAMTKPVIGAINGAAVGGAASMTLAMDLRLASTEARYGFVFARRGIVPEGCSSWFLPRIVGISQAQEWVLTGRLFGAEEALRAGLVRSIHEPGDLLPAAYALAREIADNTAPVSVALTRQMMWQMLGAAHPMTAHEIESRGVQSRGTSADAREGVRSFLDKRAPQFPDRVSDGMPGFYPWWTEPEFS